MNVKLLRQVEKFLLSEPRRFNMMDGLGPSDDLPGQIAQPPCGTACCVAGAAYIVDKKIAGELRGASRDWDSIRTYATQVLGLNAAQGGALFYLSGIHEGRAEEGCPCWPAKFEKAYIAAKTPEQRVKVAVRRIEHFIKTNGAE